jgi:hypothetical protein
MVKINVYEKETSKKIAEFNMPKKVVLKYMAEAQVLGMTVEALMQKVLNDEIRRLAEPQQEPQPHP